MAKGYNDYIQDALKLKTNLNNSISSNNIQDAIYYRGKLIHSLRCAYKLNPNAQVPSPLAVNGNSDINAVINTELTTHKVNITASIRSNKQQSSVQKCTLTNEFKLKIRNLATSITAQKQNGNNGKQITKDALSLAGTVAKAPVMVTSKVVSKIGPLAITLFMLPFTVVSSMIAVTIDIDKGKVRNDSYNNTVVHQMSNVLKKGVKDIANIAYKATGKL